SRTVTSPSHCYFTFHIRSSHIHLCFVFFFNHTAPTEIYTLSLHDALPISSNRLCRTINEGQGVGHNNAQSARPGKRRYRPARPIDRKSTRLNSSHQIISYAVFCLKKKKKKTHEKQTKIITKRSVCRRETIH